MRLSDRGYNKWLIALAALLWLSIGMSCKKMLNVDNPINEVTSNQVFSNDLLAAAAMDGLYSNMINNEYVFGVGPTSGFISVWAGTSADELEFYSYYIYNAQFQDNQLLATNTFVNTGIWQSGYQLIYSANAIIGGLQTATGVHDSVINELTGEAEVTRAFLYFYLVNFFGKIPLVTTTNFEKTALLPNVSSSEVYALIVSDLKDAQQRLPGNYTVGQGERIVPMKYSAAALLARVYLYMGDWLDAYTEADTVIANTGLYSLAPLSQVFLKNSTEAIWQLKPNATNGAAYNLTPEGNLVVPDGNTAEPFVILTPQLISAFDSGDQRWTNWVDSTMYSGTTYYFPYKYKAGPLQLSSGGPVLEYYMMLRLGEQFLIRAEAQAHGAGTGIAGAISDLSIIRARANLPAYTGLSDSTSVLDSIYHERQVELFAEWGQRWFDLKRTGQAQSVLSAIPYKQPWSNNQLQFPIPYSELIVDPNLVQNTGY